MHKFYLYSKYEVNRFIDFSGFQRPCFASAIDKLKNKDCIKIFVFCAIKVNKGNHQLIGGNSLKLTSIQFKIAIL